MTESDKCGWAGFVTGFCIALMGTMILLGTQSDSWKRESVERGYAEYVITNPIKGYIGWQWKGKQQVVDDYIGISENK